MEIKKPYYGVVMKWVVSLCLIAFMHSTALASSTAYLSEARDLVRQAQERTDASTRVDNSNVLQRLQDLVPTDTSTMSGAILFVSFAMPDESLRTWMAQAVLLEIPVIVRGLYEESLLKTQQKVASLLTDDQGGIAIDPELFKKFGVHQVPTLVLASDDKNFDKIAGNVGLETLLEAIAKHGGSSQDIARQLLARMATWTA